jgi:predicted MFS family arabinose efflux permease
MRSSSSAAWYADHPGSARIVVAAELERGGLGLIAGIELAGLGLGALSGLYWQQRWNWRTVAVPSLLAGVVGNLACLGADSYLVVCFARAMVGIAGGFLCGVYSAYAANIVNPVRMIAITTFVQIALEALFIFFAPTLSHLGAGGLFVLMALLFALLLPLIRLVPPRWPKEQCAQDGVTEHTPSWRGYWILAGFLPFLVVQTGVLTFLGQFADTAARLTGDQSLRIVGISVIFSALGSVLAYVLYGRTALRNAIAAAILVIGATLVAALRVGRTPAWFLIDISLLQIAWIFLNCMLYAALIQANNLLVPAASTLSCLGASIGRRRDSCLSTADSAAR